MPLRKGSAKGTIQANINELIGSKPSASRAKGVATIAKRQGISSKAAKAKQAVAIAYSKARKRA